MKYLLFSFILLFVFYSQTTETNNFFENGYMQQKNVITPQKDIIKAEIEGEWKEFPLVEFSQDFMKWNIETRLEQLDIIAEMMKGNRDKTPDLAGPHNGIVATYGFQRKDSHFKLNNAVKGMGFLPKPEKIKEMNAVLKKSQKDEMQKKIEYLKKLYKNADEYFDLNKQVSLELYSTPEFVTQTFLNQLHYPVSTIVFLDIPSYKLKTITRLLDPNDPELTEYEKDVTEYINRIHSFFHGDFSRNFIAVIYHVVEIYDNSPRGKNPNTGMGRRIVPALP
jgi:hypothetical protein